MKVTRLTLTGPQDTLTVSDAVFGGVVNQALLSQAVRVYLARERQGTSKTKTRAVVARTKKKWFKQKGTGNARHGARSSNIFVGGGVSHGPTGIQNWSLDLPKTMKQKALLSAFAAQAANLFVTDALTTIKQNKAVRKMLNQIQLNEEAILVIVPRLDESVIKALRNMANIFITTAANVNTLEVVKADKIVIAEAALELLEARTKGEPAVQTAEKPAPARPAKKTTEAKPAVKTRAARTQAPRAAADKIKTKAKTSKAKAK